MFTAIIIGAGNRGYEYSQYSHAFPNKLKIVGVAEPREFYRKQMANAFDIPDENIFIDWKDVSKRKKFADCVMICTPDRVHMEPAVVFAKLGYHLLLEKPVAYTVGDCKKLVAECESNGVLLSVCYVLRYTPWAKKIKELIDNGAIGEVVNIQHLQPAGYLFFAHELVRGNFRKESTSSSSFLAMCCHDLDLINFWMSGRKCTSISSFGHLNHFNKQSKPPRSTFRCLDCPDDVEKSCPYSAKRIYLDKIKNGHKGWPVNEITEVPDIESVTDALKKGPYGICVYNCDNDVMSNQIVNMEFEGGITASLTMMAFTEGMCTREVQVFGTKGQLKCVLTEAPIVHQWDFTTGEYFIHDVKPINRGVLDGFGGADYYYMETFMKDLEITLQTGINTNQEEAIQSHILALAAEEARQKNTVIKIDANGQFL